MPILLSLDIWQHKIAMLLPLQVNNFQKFFIFTIPSNYWWKRAKPSLKIRTASAIFWDYLGMFRDYGQKNIFFRNKTFLFFKIESWNFQHLFENEFCETSQSFNSFSSFRQLLFTFFLLVVWLSWNFVRFHEILFQTDAKSFSFLSWKIKKFYS